jgi:hypothetical protein
MSRWTAVETIGRGVQEAPALKSGFGVTMSLAMVGALGRVAMPILIQQSIDRGYRDGEVRVDIITVLALIGLVVVIIATVCQRIAVAPLCSPDEYGAWCISTT